MPLRNIVTDTVHCSLVMVALFNTQSTNPRAPKTSLFKKPQTGPSLPFTFSQQQRPGIVTSDLSCISYLCSDGPVEVSDFLRLASSTAESPCPASGSTNLWRLARSLDYMTSSHPACQDRHLHREGRGKPGALSGSQHLKSASVQVLCDIEGLLAATAACNGVRPSSSGTPAPHADKLNGSRLPCILAPQWRCSIKMHR